MHSPADRILARGRALRLALAGVWLPLLIFATGSAALLALWIITGGEAEARAQQVFERELARMARRLEDEMRASVLMLQGLAGLSRQAGGLPAEGFQAYVARLALPASLPWVRTVGFLELAPGGLGLLPLSGASPAQGLALPAAGGAPQPAGALLADAALRRLMQEAVTRAQPVVGTRAPAEGRAQDAGWLFVPLLVERGGRAGLTPGWAFAELDLAALARPLLEEESLRLHRRFAFELVDSAREGSGELLLRFDPAVVAGQRSFPRCHAVQVVRGHSWLLCASVLPVARTELFTPRNAGFASAWLVLALLSVLFWLQGHARARAAQAHLTLAGREAKLRAVFETSGAGIFCLDPAGIVVQANQRMAQMFACTREALLGASYVGLVPEVRREEIARRLQALAAGAAPEADVERCYRRADGSLFWGRVSARRLCDGTGRFAGLVAVMLDIDAHRRAELRLRRSEARYRLLAETMHDVVWMFDVESRCLTYCSPSVERLTGLSAAALMGAPLARVLAPASLPMAEASIVRHARRFLADERAPAQASVIELQCLRQDGSTVPVEVVSRLSRDPRSHRLVAVGVARDVGERHLLEAEQRIAAVAFEASTSLVVTDARGRIIRINKAFTVLTGYSQAEMLGARMSKLHSGRQDEGFYGAMWAEIKRSGFWQGELWNRHREGHLYPVWLSVTAVRDAAGLTSHYVGSAFDITQHFEQRSALRDLAFYDPLTGLANRRLFADRAGQACTKSARSHEYGALLCLDLDGFKRINDVHGHIAGDKLLETVGQRLRAAVRDGDTMARMGGDEFVLLLEELGRDRAQALFAARSVAEKLCQVLAEPHRVGVEQLVCPVSCGLALFMGQAESVEVVLARADQALYAAKHAGRNTIRSEDELFALV